MKTYKFNNCIVKVTDCDYFRVAQVYDIYGDYVLDIRTSAEGKEAAEIAEAEARRFRKI